MALAKDRLAEVHIAGGPRVLRQYAFELSGGMCQRVMIALGLMNEPKMIIADEPTTAIDVTAQAQVMDVIADVSERHHTAILLISHNLALVAQNCDSCPGDVCRACRRGHPGRVPPGQPASTPTPSRWSL